MKRTPVFVAACAGMAFFGVTMLSLGPILSQLDQAVPGATALPATMSAGIIAGTLLFGPVVDRFGYKVLLILSAIMTLLGVRGLAAFDQLGWLHASIFALGLGGGILNGETNALVSDIYDDGRRASRLAILGAFYCIGALGWSLLNYFMPDYRLPLNITSTLMAAAIVYFLFVKFPKRQGSHGEKVSLRAALRLLANPALLAFGAILFFQSGFEGLTGSFIVTYLERTTDIGAAAATLSLTWFTIGMLCGRLPLGAIMARLRQMGTMYIYLGVALVGVGLITGMQMAGAVYTAMALIGFGVGATYPVVIDYITSTCTSLTGTALSIAMFIGLLGQLTMNKCMGLAFDAESYAAVPIGMIGTVVAMMIILPIAVKASKRK